MTQTIRDLNTRRAGFDPEFEAAAQRAQGVSGDFAQGLRSGGTSAMSQLNTLAGHGMNALGLDGSARLQRAAEGQQEAAQEAVGLTSFDQVDGVRSGLRWAAGAVGQSAPVMAAGLGAAALTGGGAVPALAAGTLATVPFELGDQLQRQDGVAGTERMTSGERLAQALPYAAGSAALQNIVPAGVAARIAGKATPGRIIGRALADVPANAVAEGGAELVRQTGEQGIDPTRTYDLEAAKRAAIEGGALGGALGAVGAVPHALHTAAAQPGPLVGRLKAEAGELGETLGAQAQSLVGRAKDAATAVPGAVEGLDLGGKAQAAGQAVGGFVGRAKAAAEGLDLGGKVQSATEGFDLGGKVQNATEGLDLGGKAQDAAGFVGRQARAAQDAMSGVDLQPMKDKATAAYDSVSKALKGLGDAHTRGRERIKKGEQYFNPESFAGKTEGALRSALDEDSKLRDNAVTKTFQDLWNDHGLDDAQRARLAEFGKNLKDGAAQRGVMVMDELRQQAKGASEALQALAKDFAAKKPEDGTKQSADYSGVNKAVADSISTYVRDNLPHLDNRRGTEELGAGLRGAAYEMLSGKPLGPESVFRLLSVAGDHTAALLDRTREAMKVTDPKQLESFFESASQILQAQDRRKALKDTLAKEYKGEAPSEAVLDRVASQMLNWAVNKPVEGARRKFSDAQMTQQLGQHFKDPAKVFDAVDAVIPRKENMLAGTPDAAKAAALTEERTARADAADAALAKRTQEEGSDTGGEERPGLRKGEARGIDGEVVGIESRPRTRTFEKELTLSEEFRPGKNGFASAQAQAMERARAADPTARWTTADELGAEHPFVKAQADRLYEQAGLEQGLHGKDADAFVQKELKKYGTPVADLPAGHLALEPWEVNSMRLDAKRYSNSPSRVPVGDGENIFDAAKIVAMMRKRSEGKEDHMPTTGDRAGEQARLFADGVAALQAHLGKTFDIPDSTVIDATTKMTWGEARKSGLIQSNPAGVGETKVPWEMREISVPNDSQITSRIARLEAQRDELVSAAAQARFAELKAKGVFPDKALARVIWKAAREEVSETDAGAKLQRHIGRLMREHTQDEAGGVGNDLTNFNPTESGIDMGKLTHAREGVPASSQTAGVVAPRVQRINELKAELTTIRETSSPTGALGARMLQARREAAESEIRVLESLKDSPLGSGKQEFDPFGPTFQEGKTLDSITPTGITPERSRAPSLLGPSGAIAQNKSAPSKPTPAKDTSRQAQINWLDQQSRDLKGFAQKLEGRSTEQLEAMQTALENVPSDGPAFNDPGGEVRWQKAQQLVQRALDKPEGSPDPKAVAAKKAAFLERAASGDEALIGELKASSDVKGLQRAAEALAGAKPKRMGDLMGPLDMGALREGMSDSQWADPLIQEFIQVEDGSMRAELNRDASEWTAEQRKAYDAGHLEKFSRLSGYTDAEIRNWKRSQELTDAIVKKYGNDFAQDLGYGMTVASGQFDARNSGITDALRTVNDRLRTLAEDPSNAYAMLTKKYSMEGVDPNAAGPRDFKAAADYIRKVLGPKIKVAVANIMHAGEFVSRANVEDLIRISVHSLNPMSVAFHESMHGFIKNLTQAKGGDMVDVLRKAAESPSVMLALRAKLKDQPEALKQLNDPEERIAYMYQFHQLGENLGLGAPAKGVFGKIAEFIRSVLGVWSNDQRALHIMGYFHSGDYAKNMGKPDAVRQALMEPGTNARLEWFKKATEPLRQLGEAVAVAGHQRLRDTGIPALNELADVIKRQGTSVGGDQGYLPTSRRERVTRMNEFAERLGNATDADMRDALGVLQGELAQAQTSEGKVAVHMTRKLLAETKAYMEAAGVEVGDLGPDYFPRVYDLSYISSNKDAFVDVLKTHGIKDPESVMQRLMTTEGAEFDVETSRPGMQHLKRRDLAKVPDAALAPFMQKDLMRIVDGYVTQATRRAEWARRFDADGKANAKFDQLLARARKEGASEADLQTATKYMMAVDGTLGDTISPEARRLQGNIMVYQNLRLLPLMIFSSVVDPAGIMVRGGSVGDAWRAFQRGIREIPKGFKKSPTHDDATKFAATIGTIESAALNHALGTSFSQGMVGDTGRAINDKLFKYNLVEQFNTSMRVAATEAAVGFIVKHADGKASPHSARWMAELGLEPGDVQLSPEGKLMASGNAKVAAAINQWVDGAVLRPDAADKPLWMSDPHWALIAHLKQFAFSFQETILKRVAHEAKHGNMAPAYALASYVPIMIAADATKALLTGNDLGDEEWGVEDYVGHGMERAGLLGVGQFPLDASQYGLSSMFGPTVEQLRKAAEVVGGDAEFAPFALKSMPANALYRGAFETGDVAEARFRE